MKRKQLQKGLLLMMLCFASVLETYAISKYIDAGRPIAGGETLSFDPISFANEAGLEDLPSGEITDMEYWLFNWDIGLPTSKNLSNYWDKCILFKCVVSPYNYYRFSVTGIKEGKRHFHCRFKIKDGNEILSDVSMSIEITVTSSLIPDDLSIYTEEPQEITPCVNVTNVSWKSSNESILSITNPYQSICEIEGVSEGSATITLTGSLDNVSFSTDCQVTVKSSKKTVHLSNAGTLSNYISEAEKNHIKDLTITGELNGSDLRLLREMAGNNYLGGTTEGRLKVLNLNGTRIIKGGDKYLDTESIGSISGGFHYTIDEDNIMPIYAFCECSKLKSIILPSGLKSIEGKAFEYCNSLENITLPEGLEEIHGSAFFDSGLTSITIPASVNYIDGNPFGECDQLSVVNVDKNSQYYTSENGVLFDKTKETLRVYPDGKKEIQYIVPNSVKEIGNSAFGYNKSITEVKLPDGLMVINDYAFVKCGLTTIEIPSSVTRIGYGAFLSSKKIKTVFSHIRVPFDLYDPSYIASFSVYESATLYVPYGTKDLYMQCSGWKNFKNILEMEEESNQQGDVNGDNVINGTDLVALVTVVLSQQQNAAADVNGDGVVNGTDIVALVPLILNASNSRVPNGNSVR